MADLLMRDLKRRMEGAVEVLRGEFAGLRTGRASVSLLDPVMVEAYGSRMPVNQVGSVSAPEARLLTVHAQQQLGEVEQLRDVVCTLVADQLAAGLVQALGRALVLDDDEGNAVDERHEVTTLAPGADRARHRELGGHVEDVVVGLFPVDEAG